MNVVYVFTIFITSLGNITKILSPLICPAPSLHTTELIAAVLQTYYPKIYKNHVTL